jgi:hypothetical protein
MDTAEAAEVADDSPTSSFFVFAKRHQESEAARNDLGNPALSG